MDWISIQVCLAVGIALSMSFAEDFMVKKAVLTGRIQHFQKMHTLLTETLAVIWLHLIAYLPWPGMSTLTIVSKEFLILVVYLILSNLCAKGNVKSFLQGVQRSQATACS